MTYHLQSVSDVAKSLNTNPEGLSNADATQRLKESGKNLLEAKKKKTIFGIMLNQLTDFMILVLVGAAVVSGVVGEVTDTIVILAIVILNAVVGVVQEWRAEKAMEALENMAASQARVHRDNQIIDIPAKIYQFLISKMRNEL